MLQKVPGFRTGKKWKKILSSILHIFILLFLVSSFSGVTAGDKMINGARMVFFVIILYVFITNIGNIRGRIPFFKKERRTIVKIILGTVIYSLVLLLSFTTVFAATEGLLSPQQKAAELVKKQQREIESRLKQESKVREEAEEQTKKEAEKKAKEEAELQQKIADAVNDSKGDEANLEGKIVEVMVETKEEPTDQGKTETDASKSTITETKKQELKASVSKAIQEAKGDLTILQEKLKDSFKKEKGPKDKSVEEEVEIEKAIEESKNDKNVLKEKLAEILKNRKEDSSVLKQRIDKMVEDTKGDFGSIKEKLGKVLQERKDAKAMAEEARKSAKQQAENEANSPEAKKAQYNYLEYSQLVRKPQDYKGEKLVNYGTIITTYVLGKSVISVVEVAPGALVIVAIPTSDLDMNITTNDYIAFYGKFKGVTSSVSKYDLASIFSYDTIDFTLAMPYYDAQYVDILGW
jgi:hypothetical protein